MKKYFFYLIIILSSCKEKKIDFKHVISNFNEQSKQIKKIEYKIQRIDTFAQDSEVWNKSGEVLIEKDNDDEIFGFSFYGKRNDVPKEYIYDQENGFEIYQKDKTYKVELGNYGFIGSPGGQMVSQNIFTLDSIYKKVTLRETEKSYLLTYEFENDTIHNITDIRKTVTLNKKDFFPFKIYKSSKQFGKTSVTQTIISDVKINKEVTKSIKELKSTLKDYTIIESENQETNKLLLNKVPKLKLPKLFDINKSITINNDKLTLIDFWEVWCSPCILSLPKVENLKNLYLDELTVIGIVSENKEDAIKLIKNKEITFINLEGNSALKNTFNVNSIPRYFLIDKDGIMLKEYFGFSEKIENDIKDILSKKK